MNTGADRTGLRCSACGASMVCGRDDPAGCWCAQEPALPLGKIVAGQDCLCANCLRSRQTAAAPSVATPE